MSSSAKSSAGMSSSAGSAAYSTTSRSELGSARPVIHSASRYPSGPAFGSWSRRWGKKWRCLWPLSTNSGMRDGSTSRQSTLPPTTASRRRLRPAAPVAALPHELHAVVVRHRELELEVGRQVLERDPLDVLAPLV